MEALVKKRLDEMMEGKWDRKIYDYWHSYQIGKYYNTLLTSPCTCHSYCETGNEAGCTCLIGRSHVLNNSDAYSVQDLLSRCSSIFSVKQTERAKIPSR